MRQTIGGYLVERISNNLVWVEGCGSITDEKAREIIGINFLKNKLESEEKKWNNL